MDEIIELYLRDIDRTLLRHNLILSVEERFIQLMKLQEFADELRTGMKNMETKETVSRD